MSRKGRKRKAREKKREARTRRPNPPASIQSSKSTNAGQATACAEPQPTKLGEYQPRGPVEYEKSENVTAPEVPAEEKNLVDWRSRRRRIWQDFRNGMFVAVALLALKLSFEDSWVVNRFRLMTEDLMQIDLASTFSMQDLPVAVVDISNIELVGRDVPGRQATPREPLRHLLEVIAEQNPSAIGIDIDFSPDDHGLQFRSDPEFFKYCLALLGPRKARIPIFLGVHRSEMLRPEQWLDSEEFQDLATTIAVPPNSGKMVEAISVMNSVRPLPAMSAALANAYRRGRPIWELPRWMFRRLSEGSSRPDLFHAREFSVDFGPLDILEAETIPVDIENTKPIIVFSPKRPLSGKMVLLGNAVREKAFDQFNIPARSVPKPGVYLHACAAYTLVTKPLFELTFVGGIVLDLLLATTAFLILVLIRLCYYKKALMEVATHSMEIVLLISLAVGALVLGIWFVHRTRVIWEDSVLVSIALLAHPSVADLIRWVRRVVAGGWKAGVFEATK